MPDLPSGIVTFLFTADASRIPPGSEPEHGPERIPQSEQAAYDSAHWSIHWHPVDALQLNDQWDLWYCPCGCDHRYPR